MYQSLMVSLQAALSSRKEELCSSCSAFKPPPPSSKRKRGDEEGRDANFLAKEPKLAAADEAAAEETIELQFDRPLPLEWQRCLDIKSGQIHYYNTRTHKRTSSDPRVSHDEPAAPLLSLDLELNLACDPRRRPGSKATPPPLTTAADCREMVAAVCMRCHMLVMMSRATLSCPNCKFVHPPSPVSAPPNAREPGFKLLLCKD